MGNNVSLSRKCRNVIMCTDVIIDMAFTQDTQEADRIDELEGLDDY